MNIMEKYAGEWYNVATETEKCNKCYDNTEKENLQRLHIICVSIDKDLGGHSILKKLGL